MPSVLFANKRINSHIGYWFGIVLCSALIAKLHGLEPYQYLNSIFKALPYAETVGDIEALLPWDFKAKEISH